MKDGGLRSLRNYWTGIQHSAAASGAPLQLPALAVRIHDINHMLLTLRRLSVS